MTDPTLLRRAIESVGIEKPSDYTLVLEEVERLMDENIVGRLRHLVSLDKPENGGPYHGLAARECVKAMEIAATQLESHAALIRAATDLVQEMEEMGYGKTSDRALPGSWDTMVAALEAVKK